MFAIVKNGISYDNLSHLERIVKPVLCSSNAYTRNIADVSHLIPDYLVKQIDQHMRCRMAEQEIHIPEKGCLYASGAQLINAPPYAKASQYWHRDTVYEAYTVIIPFCDLNEENGCTQILPDSTFGPIRRYRKKQENAVLGHCKRGSVIVFDSRLIHRGLKNKTSHDRLVLALEFCEDPHMFTIT